MKINTEAYQLLSDYLETGNKCPRYQLVKLEQDDFLKAYELLEETKSLSYGERQWYMKQYKVFPKCVESGYDAFRFTSDLKQELRSRKRQDLIPFLDKKLNSVFSNFDQVLFLSKMYGRIEGHRNKVDELEPYKELIDQVDNTEDLTLDAFNGKFGAVKV